MIRVGVLVGLKRQRGAGGHVKCWERLAEAAAQFKDELDLTVHFLGDRPGRIELSERVRYLLHRPVLSSQSLPFVASPEPIDLSPWHRGLLPRLADYDVIHSTEAFSSFARTALRFCSATRVPLVSSIHTDVPGYVRIYAGQRLRRILGRRMGDWTLRRWRLDDRVARRFEERLRRYLARSDRILVSRRDELRSVERLFPGRTSWLRRGIDKRAFHPDRRDRERLERSLGIPPGRLLLLFVGRVNPEKNVRLVAEAARILLDRGRPIHLLIAGEGSETPALAARLGPALTLAGYVPPAGLPRFYASSDLFLFPSTTEEFGNVVLEAKASGLPVLLAGGPAVQTLKQDGKDGLVLPGDDPRAWAEAIEALWKNPRRRGAMGAEARRHIEDGWPSWSDVLEQDLFRVWEALGRKSSPQLFLC